MIYGTIVNVLTVTIGSIIGLSLRSKLPQAIIERVFQAIGLFTMVLGVYMAIKVDNVLVMIFALVLGAITGELLRLDYQINKGADKIKRLVPNSHDRFSEGLITAFLLFCTGSMTILGSIDEGVGNGNTILLSKSILDGFASIALAGSLGIGVLFSIVPLFILQASITLLAYLFGSFISPEISLAISSTGGVLLIGLGFNLLDIKDIKVINILPAILFAPFFIWILSLLN